MRMRFDANDIRSAYSCFIVLFAGRMAKTTHQQSNNLVSMYSSVIRRVCGDYNQQVRIFTLPEKSVSNQDDAHFCWFGWLITIYSMILLEDFKQTFLFRSFAMHLYV